VFGSPLMPDLHVPHADNLWAVRNQSANGRRLGQGGGKSLARRDAGPSSSNRCANRPQKK
jgi:hypothetical protein